MRNCNCQGAWRHVYAAKFAHQQDYRDNPLDLGVNYYAGELGVTRGFGQRWLESVTLKADVEVLDGDGPAAVGVARVARAFQTPLATSHPFQGWANRFLVTPADGVVDVFGTLGAKLAGTSFALIYHDFDAERGGHAYGQEWDAQVTHVFREYYTLGFKYARYEAAGNARNLARNGAASAGKQAYDLGKVWAWAEMRY